MNRKIENFLDNLIDYIWMVDLDLNYIYISKGVEHYGYSVDDMIGKNVMGILSDESIKKVKSVIKEHYMLPVCERPATITMILENKINNSNDTYFVETTIGEHFTKDGVLNGWCGMSRDVTKRLEIQETLIENKMLNTAIEVCGGICHDMAQPLQVMYGNISMLRLFIDDGDKEECLKLLDIIDSKIESLGDMLKKMQGVKKYRTKPYMGMDIFDMQLSDSNE